MNQCQYCGAAATVHLTDIVNLKKRELHLCEECAREKNLLPAEPGPQLNLQALIHLLVGQSAGPSVEAEEAPSALNCPSCGLQYAQFRADGRLGCPADYDAFRDALEPLLEKVHRGLIHAGKVPRAVRRTRQDAELDQLRTQLGVAVADEEFEAAARLRDAIRMREKEAAE